MNELTYDWDAGLTHPVHCTFEDTEDGPRLIDASIGGVDIYDGGCSPLMPAALVSRIEDAAYSHLERQAEQINAERRAEFLPWRGLRRAA